MKFLGKTFRQAADRFDPPTRVIRLEPILGEAPVGIPQVNLVTTVSAPRRMPAVQRRSYAGAAHTNVFANWIASQSTGDSELRSSYRTLLNRCRELERNNPHMAALLRAVEMNVAGPNGFTFQSNVTEARKDKSGIFRDMPDDLANNRIEAAFYKWQKPQFCSLNGKLSFAAFQRLLVRTVARDGTCLIRKIKGASAKNAFSFALQLLEVDHLDLDDFSQKQNGNIVKFGIEFDPDGRPVSYSVFTIHPGDSSVQAGYSRAKISIPASEMMLVMMPRRVSQVIGDPWVVSAMGSLQMLGKLQEYELVASMVSSCKGGFYVKKGDGTDSVAMGTQSEGGSFVQDATPGAFEQLPEGWDFQPFDPTHPTATISEFAKLIVREIAVGVGVAASTLSGDLSDTNYSSMRAGLGEERESWKMLQNWLVETVIEPLFPEWLEMAMLSGQLNLPFSKFEKFNQPKFHGRRWTSVNPAEDAKALQTLITMGVMSRTRWLNENAGDFGETITELGKEMAMAEAMKVPIIAMDPYQNQNQALDNSQESPITAKP